MTENISLDTIRGAWEYLLPLIYAHVNRPSKNTEKELVEEAVKFDTLLKGDLLALMTLFRDTTEEHKKKNAALKLEAEKLRHEICSYPSYPQPEPERFPSPIEDWGGEYRH